MACVPFLNGKTTGNNTQVVPYRKRRKIYENNLYIRE
jgi:hypothetical protein